MKQIILVALCLHMVYGMNAQERSVSEEDISFEILKWHYTTYPKSEANRWSVLNAADGNYYRVRFEFQNQSYLVEYNEKGMIMHEAVNLGGQVPVSIAHELEVFEKYKISRFLKISDKEKNRVVYKLDVKVKSEGPKTLWYDENFIQIPNTDFSQSITEM